jgi:hypothetical protein
MYLIDCDTFRAEYPFSLQEHVRALWEMSTITSMTYVNPKEYILNRLVYEHVAYYYSLASRCSAGRSCVVAFKEYGVSVSEM